MCIENILCQKHHYYVPRIGPTSLPPAKYHLPILGMKQMSRILCFSHAHFRSQLSTASSVYSEPGDSHPFHAEALIMCLEQSPSGALAFPLPPYKALSSQ